MTQSTKFREFLEKQYQESHFKSIREFAKEADVGHSYLSKILNGKRENPPSPEILEKLAEALNIDYNILMQKAGYLKVINEKNIKENISDELTYEEKIKVIKKLFDDLEVEYIEVINEARKKDLSPEDLKTIIKISKKLKNF